MDFYKKNWPFVLASIVIVCLSVYSYIAIVQTNDGTFVYALDDAYIHMAIAKNVALHGVWGVTQYGFSSSSSSLLWTALLSIVFWVEKALGLQRLWEYAPYVLNMIFAILTLFVSDTFVSLFVKSKIYRFVTLIIIILFLPLPILIVSGMEHTMHLFLTLLFVYLFVKEIYVDNTNQLSIGVYVTALFMTAARYEGLFVIAAVMLLLFVRKQFRSALGLLSASLIVHLVYGIISVSKGWYIVPNTLLIKSGVGALADFFTRISMVFGDVPERIFEKQILFVFMAILVLFLFLRSYTRRVIPEAFEKVSYVFLISTMLHLALARIGWLFRYEAYLLVLGIVLLCIYAYLFGNYFYKQVKDTVLQTTDIVVAAVLICTFVLFVPRIQVALWAVTESSKSIYDQHYQLGTFVHRYYNNASIAATDIGEIAYMSDIHLVDLLGLGDRELGKRMVEHTYTLSYMDHRIRDDNVHVIFAYDDFFDTYFGASLDQLPWELVAKCRILGNNFIARAVVLILADSPDSVKELKQHLLEYSNELPANVEIVLQ